MADATGASSAPHVKLPTFPPPCGLCAARFATNPPDAPSKKPVFTLCDLARLSAAPTATHVWLCAHGAVYAVPHEWLSNVHPGGGSSILSHAGAICDIDFDFHSSKARKVWGQFLEGTLECKSSACVRYTCTQMDAALERIEEEAHTRGFDEGVLAGEAQAARDGARLGRLHGAALACELGALEGFASVALAVFGDGAASRSARAAAQLRDSIKLLGVGVGEDAGVVLPAPDVDIVVEVQRCRGRAKVLAAVVGLPPTLIDDFVAGPRRPAALTGSGGGSPTDAAATAARVTAATIDF